MYLKKQTNMIAFCQKIDYFSTVKWTPKISSNMLHCHLKTNIIIFKGSKSQHHHIVTDIEFRFRRAPRGLYSLGSVSPPDPPNFLIIIFFTLQNTTTTNTSHACSILNKMSILNKNFPRNIFIKESCHHVTISDQDNLGSLASKNHHHIKERNIKSPSQSSRCPTLFPVHQLSPSSEA